MEEDSICREFDPLAPLLGLQNTYMYIYRYKVFKFTHNNAQVTNKSNTKDTEHLGSIGTDQMTDRYCTCVKNCISVNSKFEPPLVVYLLALLIFQGNPMV